MKDGLREEAVSPVIGVIMMVAITVILAATVLVFALGVDAPESPHSVGLSAKMAGDDALVTITGGDFDALDSVTISGDNIDEVSEDGPFTVGQRFTLVSNDGEQVSGRLLVVGHFTDGTDSILIDREI